MPLSEFDLINTYFRNAFKDGPDVKCGIGDDAAIVSLPAGVELAISVDTLVSGIHFPINTRPDDIGYKSMAVNLSDMAAMGAEPRWITLSLTMPENDPDWLAGFMSGFSVLAKQYALSLIGGDLSQGPLSVTVQIHGFVPEGKALYRHGAKTGDLIYVSGTLGDAGLALGMTAERYKVEEKHREYLMNRLNRPTPQIGLGMALRGIANSAIDISDGLLADLNHILESSNKGAFVNVDNISMYEAVKSQPDAIDIALTSGDDYELCFTIPPEKQSQVENELQKKFRLSCVGNITDGKGIIWQHEDSSEFHPQGKAYQHF
jgi:thiamine-monophosphate kinase